MIADAVRLGEVNEYSLRQLPPQLQQKILQGPQPAQPIEKVKSLVMIYLRTGSLSETPYPSSTLVRAPQGALTGQFKGPLREARTGPICKMQRNGSRGPHGLPGSPPRIPQIGPRNPRIGPRTPQLAREFPSKIPRISLRGP